MGMLSFLAKVYDLDTLDTRFKSSSAGPYHGAAGDARGDAAKAHARARRPPSRWRTPEFCLYYFVFALAVPSMFWTAYSVSSPSDPRYHKFQHLLSDGWIPGRKVDVSDAQYHTFRENLPYMGALLVVHPLLRWAWDALGPRASSPGGPARLARRASFDCAFALFFLAALHGFSALKVLAILGANFRIAKGLPPRYVPAATWAFNIAVLFANELCEGYRLGPLAARIAPPASALVRWGAWLDGHGGLVPRWEVLFNISVLRLISFNMDYYWSLDGRRGGGGGGGDGALEVSGPGVERRDESDASKKKQLDPARLPERERIARPAEAGDFSLRNYVAYAAYAPLYLAGPIVTFNDYVAQARHRCASIERGRTGRYAVRLALALLAMELVLHYDYVGAIAKASPAWGNYTAAQLSLLSYFNLHVIWLKLLLPWRLFRLWALVDGVDAPENMARCVSNNYSTQLFWRAWHRSYNRWLIRYLFVPLGGASFGSWRAAARSALTYLAVFTFVALWHDLRLRLLVWGWLVVLFMMPEWAASRLFPRRRWEGRPTAYRALCGVGGVANVLMMMAANLVGFAVGLDGLESIVGDVLHDWSGFLFLVVACSCLFVGVQVMFEIRESERRRSVTLRC